MDLAGLLISGVSALGSLVQAFYSAKSSNKSIDKSAINKAEKRALSPLKVGTKKVEDVIDEELLTTLSIEIDKHNKSLIEAFRSEHMTEAEHAIKVEMARTQICKVLSEVMRFNEGSLPTKRLEKLWASNRCRT
ncbi:MAG: hypothetical protein OCD00_11265 [Colwellia sp.]